jgi:flagellar FliJ protein
MLRFRFRLERFLELKRHKEREQELALAKALGECMLLKNRISEIALEVDAERGKSFLEGGRIDIEGMARRELYITRLMRESKRTEIRLEEKTAEMEKVRARYLEAAKERKILDKLKERKGRDYYERQKQEEFKTLDDLNTAAHLREHW